MKKNKIKYLFALLMSITLTSAMATSALAKDTGTKTKVTETSMASESDKSADDMTFEMDAFDMEGLTSAMSKYLSDSQITGAAFGSMSEDDKSDFFSAMQSSISTGGSVNLTELMNTYANGSFSQIEYFSIEDSKSQYNTDIGLLNSKYDGFVASFDSSYQMTDISGGSKNVTKKFNSAFGDVLGKNKLGTPTIPKGFDINSMLGAAGSSFYGQYQGNLDSIGFNSIKSSISIGDVFANANAIMSDTATLDTGTFKDGQTDGMRTNRSNYEQQRQASDQNAAQRRKTQADDCKNAFGTQLPKYSLSDTSLVDVIRTGAGIGKSTLKDLAGLFGK